MDQASFLALQALGHGALLQFSWIYNRPVNVDGLRRFHRNLAYGLGRRVERSPLPFARDRWVVYRGPVTGRTNSEDALREDLARTFAEFNVTAEIQG